MQESLQYKNVRRNIFICFSTLKDIIYTSTKLKNPLISWNMIIY